MLPNTTGGEQYLTLPITYTTCNIVYKVYPRYATGTDNITVRQGTCTWTLSTIHTYHYESGQLYKYFIVGY